VSQNPVLLGTTLREAVVFPEQPEEADAERFAAALAAAGVAEMVAGFSRGLDTSVGEAGNQLSGGQRQRLALAHALYRARDLLVLDEATGQLDPDSESAIVAAVAALPRDLTIVVASHRAPIFACCDIVYRLVAGKLVKAV
jgi:ABC-type transport system involved in cytochrome bd biosynthesis fused ATPase/permease subunit